MPYFMTYIYANVYILMSKNHTDLEKLVLEKKCIFYAFYMAGVLSIKKITIKSKTSHTDFIWSLFTLLPYRDISHFKLQLTITVTNKPQDFKHFKAPRNRGFEFYH